MNSYSKGAKAKPFIKWAGGKGQLIEQLDAQLPRDFGDRHNITYIEPFVGGGAMIFYRPAKHNFQKDFGGVKYYS